MPHSLLCITICVGKLYAHTLTHLLTHPHIHTHTHTHTYTVSHPSIRQTAWKRQRWKISTIVPGYGSAYWIKRSSRNWRSISITGCASSPPGCIGSEIICFFWIKKFEKLQEYHGLRILSTRLDWDNCIIHWTGTAVYAGSAAWMEPFYYRCDCICTCIFFAVLLLIARWSASLLHNGISSVNGVFFIIDVIIFAHSFSS